MIRMKAQLLIGLIATMIPGASLLASEISGKAVYKHCKSCHGNWGKGSPDGKYPRIAHLPKAYIEKQLHDFKEKRRINKTMIPIFKHHRFDSEVISIVSKYISEMPKQEIVWSYEPSKDTLAYFGSRPEYEESGKRIYSKNCRNCHGDVQSGESLGEGPSITNQYIEYLDKQITDFQIGQRKHEHSADCSKLRREELEAVFHHLVAGKK